VLPQHRAPCSKGRSQDKLPSLTTFEEEMNSSIVASAPGAPPAHTRKILLGRPRALWQRLSRAPLLQFVALGALIFAVDHLVQSERIASQRQIVVDGQLKHRLQLVNQTQSGFTPGPQLRIVWRQPIAGIYAVALVPTISTGWLRAAPYSSSRTDTTYVREWRIPAPHADLVGASWTQTVGCLPSVRP
jgi:hypothetical protein